jgi:hypothetical protein
MKDARCSLSRDRNATLATRKKAGFTAEAQRGEAATKESEYLPQRHKGPKEKSPFWQGGIEEDFAYDPW